MKLQVSRRLNCFTGVLSYLLKTRDKLRLMFDMGRAKEQAENYYDRKSRSETFGVGQKVLWLTNTSNLLAGWKGSYVITDRVSPVDYNIKLRGNTDKVFHLNMLKLWYGKPHDVESSKREILACLDGISDLSTTDDQPHDILIDKINPAASSASI